MSKHMTPIFPLEKRLNICMETLIMLIVTWVPRGAMPSRAAAAAAAAAFQSCSARFLWRDSRSRQTCQRARREVQNFLAPDHPAAGPHVLTTSDVPARTSARTLQRKPSKSYWSTMYLLRTYQRQEWCVVAVARSRLSILILSWRIFGKHMKFTIS